MPNRSRAMSAESPLLGMIVDRTSFDEDDPVSATCQSKSRSFDDDDDSLSLYSSSPGGFQSTKSGKVRRKLRWRPTAFRSRRNTKSSAASVMSSSVKSTKTTKSTMSFHTFHSTETPIRDNKKVPTPFKIGRPRYSDSFEGVATIDNEGRYIHSRMTRSTQRNIPRSQTMPPTNSETKHGGWDFNSVSNDDMWQPFDDSESRTVFDPYGDAMGSSNKKQLPPQIKPTFQLSLSAPSTPRQSPRKKESPYEPRSGTPSTVASSVSDVSVSGFPSLESEDFEGSQFISTLGKGSPKSKNNVKDAAEGWDVSMSQNVEAQSPSGTFPRHTPTTTKQRSPPMGRPPMSPAPRARRSEAMEVHCRNPPDEELTSEESFKPVPAKVSVDISKLQSLKQMVVHSGLLNGSQYLPERYFSDMPITMSSHKAYNRPNDESSSFASESTDGIQSFSEDDSISTRNSIESGEVLIEDLQAPPGDENDQRKDAQTPRRSSGPVDLDDGTFLQAEKNLRAIHDMAAEHLEHGEYEEALEVFEEILRGQKTRYGPDHSRVGTALHNIGIVHLKSKQFEKAVKVCQQAVDVRKHALDANHPDIAVSLAQLGVAHLECGQFRKALVAFREALNIRRRYLGPKHAKVGKLLNNIGCALVAVDEFEAAKLAFEEALEIHRETLKTNSSSKSNRILLTIASTLCNLASIKGHWGLYEEAGVSLEEALLLQQSVLGDDHPIVLRTIRSIEFVERALNREEASSAGRTFKDIYTRTCNSTPEFLLPDLDDEEDCAASQPGPRRVININLVQMLGLDKSKRWYSLIEQNVVAAENAACSPVETTRSDVGATARTSLRRRQKRSNLVEI